MTSPQYDVALCKMTDLSTADQLACVSIIHVGDAVSVASARLELPKALGMVVVRLQGRVVGVGAIKKPRVTYAAKIAKESGFPFPPETLELGYVAVDPVHRGRRLSNKLLDALLAGRTDRLFATTSRPEMKKTLERAGFVRRGREWGGHNGELSLWMRE